MENFLELSFSLIYIEIEIEFNTYFFQQGTFSFQFLLGNDILEAGCVIFSSVFKIQNNYKMSFVWLALPKNSQKSKCIQKGIAIIFIDYRGYGSSVGL